MFRWLFFVSSHSEEGMQSIRISKEKTVTPFVKCMLGQPHDFGNSANNQCLCFLRHLSFIIGEIPGFLCDSHFRHFLCLAGVFQRPAHLYCI